MTAVTGLRVIQVVYSEGFAGLERHMATLSNGLAESGCQVTVLGGPPKRMPAELSSAVAGWHPIGGVAEAFARLARSGHVDIVHAHMTHAELAATIARPMTGGHLIVTRHFAAPRGSRLAGRVAALAIRRAVELQLAPSAYAAARVDGPCEVIVHGVPTVAGPESRDREPLVLVVQRLEAYKDTDVALRAWARSRLGQRGWRLLILGDGSQRLALEHMAQELSVADSCAFWGRTDDVRPYLNRASIMLAPAPAESFGMAVVEAMAAAVPVVAAASGGHLETVGAHPQPALFAPGDADQAALRLRELAGDDERRLSYGRELQALQRGRFSAEREVAETLARYQALVAG